MHALMDILMWDQRCTLHPPYAQQLCHLYHQYCINMCTLKPAPCTLAACAQSSGQWVLLWPPYGGVTRVICTEVTRW